MTECDECFFHANFARQMFKDFPALSFEYLPTSHTHEITWIYKNNSSEDNVKKCSLELKPAQRQGEPDSVEISGSCNKCSSRSLKVVIHPTDLRLRNQLSFKQTRSLFSLYLSPSISLSLVGWFFGPLHCCSVVVSPSRRRRSV